MPVSLEALMRELPGIGAFDPDRWYRAHGSGGAADFRDTGQVRAKPDGKYPSTYYSKGGVESRYMPKGKGAIVEALRGVEDVPDSRRYGITPKGQELSKADRIRLWELMQDGKYKSTYDNITPWKHGARVLRDQGSPLGLALGTMAGAYEGYNTPTEQYEQATGLEGLPARALGVMGSVGDSLTMGGASALGRLLAGEH